MAVIADADADDGALLYRMRFFLTLFSLRCATPDTSAFSLSTRAVTNLEAVDYFLKVFNVSHICAARPAPASL